MHYSLDEQETFIHFNADTLKLQFESSYPPHIKKILALDCLENVETDTGVNNRTGEKQVTWIRGDLKENFRMNLFPKKRRVLTEAQKSKLMENWKGHGEE